MHQTILAKGVAMKGFNFFKNYPTRTVFNFETNEFEERHIRKDFELCEQPNQLDVQAPLALTYLIFGLKQSAKRSQKF
jgi:hypothetical protein